MFNYIATMFVGISDAVFVVISGTCRKATELPRP